MNILGVSAYYHDSAACLLRDGEIVAAAQEEAFSRAKHDPRLPAKAIGFCLRQSGLHRTDIDWIGYYELPALKLQRIHATHAASGVENEERHDAAVQRFVSGRLDVGGYFESFAAGKTRILATEHHISHAASAFYPSPFEDAAIVTIDGVGEYATTSIAHGRGNRIDALCDIAFPHSLGLFYSAFTYYLGFKVNSGEYKVMGLAPYGEPTFVDRIERSLIRVSADGAFKLNMDYFSFLEAGRMINARFEDLMGGPSRRDGEPLTERHMDIARSVQVVLEHAVMAVARRAQALTGAKNLCMAGGVALNCVANGKLLREGPFENIWVQPAASDAGGALGVAYYIWHQHLGQRRSPSTRDRMANAYLGPEASDAEIRQVLEVTNATYATLDSDTLISHTAGLLAEGKVVAWFQGRLEFGPRALGNRSIFGDPRNPEMQRRLNLKVKFRESFRPFAPVVLEEDAAEWFDLDRPSPYMLFVADVAARRMRPLSADEESLRGLDRLRVNRSDIPAVTHVDGSARIQTVGRDENPLLRKLLLAFKAVTGCPVLVNTSFNVRGEPIVCTPLDALRCFMATEMDYLVMGSHILRREDQHDLFITPARPFTAD